MKAELRIEQSVIVVKQLPAILMTNGVWMLIYCFVVGWFQVCSFLMAGVMGALLVPMFSSYLKLRNLSRPTAVSPQRITCFTLHLGLLGLFWAVCMVSYLPKLPFDSFVFLSTGCVLLTALAAAAIHVIPSASAAYSIPIFLALTYASFSVNQTAWSISVLLIAFVAVGMTWITVINRSSFLAMSNATVERAQLLTASKAAIVSRNQFLENVNHEIKTPLTAVLGYTRLLMARKSRMPSDDGETLERLNVSVETLLKTIDALLDVTKLNAGQLPLHEDSYDPRHLVRQAFASVETLACTKNIELGQSFEAEIPSLLVGDAGRIEQIVSNLLDNAIKFTSSGRVDLTVGCWYPESSLGSEKMLCISVRDTGIGIDASKKASVFHSFYQVDASVTRRHGGMGLGLTVSRMLARLMKGDLDFESDGVNGTTFKCWLPFKPYRPHGSQELSQASSARPQAESRHVLVVDDDVYIRHYLHVLLCAAGWQVESCDSGEAAILQCSKHTFDLILMDIQMPVMTGIDASRIIWSGEKNKLTPILVITGYLSTDRIAELREAGLFNYLGKPLVPDELIAKARQAMGILEHADAQRLPHVRADRLAV